jgi:hypothetical protein
VLEEVDRVVRVYELEEPTADHASGFVPEQLSDTVAHEGHEARGVERQDHGIDVGEQCGQVGRVDLELGPTRRGPRASVCRESVTHAGISFAASRNYNGTNRGARAP